MTLNEYDSYKTKNSQGLFINVNLEGHNPISIFKLIQMPGCCGICISTGVYISPEYRNKGIGTILNELRKQMAIDFGYSILLCTDVDNNTFQKKILTKNGFKQIYQFVNSRTENTVNISLLDLSKEK